MGSEFRSRDLLVTARTQDLHWVLEKTAQRNASLAASFGNNLLGDIGLTVSRLLE